MPESCRVLIADDEGPARAKLRRLLEPEPGFELVGEARNGIEALELTRKLKPDLLFLDIQMPGLTGFEVLEHLEPPLPAVVFATAYDHFALQAFEASAADYLLKPFDGPRFTRALHRAAQLVGRRRGDDPLLPLLNTLAERPLERLVARDGERWVPLDLARVTRLKAEGKTVRVFAEGREHLVRRPLQDLEARLDPSRFVRVHRGDLVALDAIAHFESWDHGDGLLVMKDGSHVTLSRTYRAALFSRWGCG